MQNETDFNSESSKAADIILDTLQLNRITSPCAVNAMFAIIFALMKKLGKSEKDVLKLVKLALKKYDQVIPLK